MSNYRTDRAEFLDIFPAEERLLRSLDSTQAADNVLLIDLGGGVGHDIQVGI